jgi:hypothetical protein
MTIRLQNGIAKYQLVSEGLTIMDRLFKHVFGIHTLGGTLFFGVLFSSKMESFEKIMFGVLMVCMSATMYFILTGYFYLSRAVRQLDRSGGRSAMSSIATDARLSSTEMPTETEDQAAVLDIRNSRRLPFALWGMFAVWLIGGSAISGFVG